MGFSSRAAPAKANVRLRSLTDIQTVTPFIERDELDAENPVPYRPAIPELGQDGGGTLLD
jgi:hypothetical protein